LKSTRRTHGHGAQRRIFNGLNNREDIDGAVRWQVRPLSEARKLDNTNIETKTVAPAGPALWSARNDDGVLLAFGRSRGEAQRAAVMVSGGEPARDDREGRT